MWPLPTVRHFIACREFGFDPETGEATCTGLIYRLRPAVFPTLLASVDLVIQLSDGAGEIGLTVVLVRTDDDYEVERSEEVPFPLADRLQVYTTNFRFESVPIEVAGVYEFRLIARAVREANRGPRVPWWQRIMQALGRVLARTGRPIPANPGEPRVIATTAIRVEG